MNRGDALRLMQGLSGAPELVETHSSLVILAEEIAYKIKKDVHFSFLDFSTVELRRQDTVRELELNRRLAPEVYLDVVNVCAEGELLRLGMPGEECANVVDHALRMKRLDREMEMDKVLERGEVTGAFLEILAAKVAAFHNGALVIREGSQATPEGYASDFNDILQEEEIFRQQLGNQAVESLRAVVAVSDHFLETHSHHIAERLESGWVRDVHGDLHTRNIFAYADPVIFDCLEFNAHFRQIDVLNEVAFLCMDLESRGFAAFSQQFIDAYDRALHAFQTPEDRNLFVWFKCYRANVRAKVAAIRASQATDIQSLKSEMASYLELMAQYAAQLAAMPSE
ncbi:MAG: hypothetical protein U0176_11370 [Bacteroidia bacterium]